MQTGQQTGPNVILENTTQTCKASSTSRRRPPIIDGFESTGIQILAPIAIERKIKDGWVDHIGLEFLTDAFCLDPATQATISPNSNDRDAIEHPSEREKNLSIAEWMQAWRRFLSLLQAHQPSLHGPWKEHYMNIVNREGLSLEWRSWLLYDIQVRFTSLRTGIDPQIFHKEIWDRARRSTESELVRQAITSELQSEIAQTIDAQVDRKIRELRPPPPPASATLKRPLMASENEEYPSFRPFKRCQLIPQAEAAAASSNPFPPTSTQHWPKCFICNSPAGTHGEWFRCDRRTTVEGRPVRLARDGSGRFVHADDGRRICYDFNRKFSGCRDKACTKGEHSCSLCGSYAHGAQRCQ